MSRRVAVNAAEIVVAVLLVPAAFWCWHRGLRTADFPPYTKGVAVQPITYYSGPWVSAAVGCVVLAALLSLDTVRRHRGCSPAMQNDGRTTGC